MLRRIVLLAAVLLSGCRSDLPDQSFHIANFLILDWRFEQVLGGVGPQLLPRDVQLLFVFNHPLRLRSVKPSTIRITYRTESGQVLDMPGKFFAVEGRPRWARFDPRFSAGNLTSTPDLVYGMPPGVTVHVHVPSGRWERPCVRSRDGLEFRDEFRTHFTTKNTPDGHELVLLASPAAPGVQFHDSGVEEPIWLEAFALPDASVPVEFQGAMEACEEAVITPWADDIRDLSGCRFLRFRPAERSGVVVERLMVCFE
jgi:hypothetical protein